MNKHSIVPIERIEKKIHFLREKKVMLRSDLAELYGVEVRALVQAVKRNIERFPEDFMFQLNEHHPTQLGCLGYSREAHEHPQPFVLGCHDYSGMAGRRCG